MSVSKIINANDIINGLAVVQLGSSTDSYDNPARSVHFTNPSGLQIVEELAARYIYHGGPGGSGNWEH